jgi:hypothetical protein
VSETGAPAPRRGRGRFAIGLLASSVISLVGAVALTVLLVVAAGHVLLPNGASPRPSVSPSSRDPGTYVAGRLRAPDTLTGTPLSPATTAEDVKNLQKARDEFSKAAGGAPAIAANYGHLVDLKQLTGAQGYVDPDQFFAGSTVKYEMFDKVKCGTAMVSICIRSDQAQALAVVVSGLADSNGSGATMAGAVDEAWRDLGGR